MSIQPFTSQKEDSLPELLKIEAVFLEAAARKKDLPSSILSLKNLLSDLSAEKQEKILLTAFHNLGNFSDMREERVALLILYGDHFLQKEPTFPHILTAVRSFATAYIIQEDPLLQEKSSSAIIRFVSASGGEKTSSFLIDNYRDELIKIRTLYEEEAGTVREMQKGRTAAFRNFFSKLLQEALASLGKPPCGFDIRAMGSLAREEVCPYSDLEYFILIEKEKYRSYFQKVAEIFDLQILSLGETDPKQQEIFNFGQPFGLEIDHQSNPAYHDSLIGTPEQLFRAPKDKEDPDLLKAYKSRLHSISLCQNQNFSIPASSSKEFASALLKLRREERMERVVLQGEICELKSEIVEPLVHFLGDLGLYFGVEESNTFDVIEKIPLFDYLSKQFLQETVSRIYQLRVKAQLAHKEVRETVSLVPSLALPTLSEQEKDLLEQACLAIDLLYQVPLHVERQNLLALAFTQPSAQTVRCVTKFLLDAPIEEHIHYYQKLHMPDQVALQEIYLASIPHHAEVLSEFPNRAGYRLSRKREEESLLARLQTITTEDPSSSVRLSSPLIGEKYLKTEAAKKLLKGGHLIKAYPESLHNVTSLGGLHFKELPYQPLMEYAVYSLTHRIMGKATPTTTLARLELLEKNMMFPVLISETIPGERVEANQEFETKHLTWLCLVEMLTKPGDGRLSNYVYLSGKIYSIDNDLSLMEPLYQKRGKQRVAFCSLLFTIDFLLSEEVVREFCSLEPDLILADWLKELEEQESLYLSLFPLSEERNTLFEADKKRRFSPSMVISQGTLATLCLQFYHLQDVLKKKKIRTPLTLLRELLTLNRGEKVAIGPYIASQYEKAAHLPFSRRLQVATGSRSDQSLTSEQAMEINFKAIPSFEEIEKREVFSLEEASSEFYLLETHKQWNQLDEKCIEADFSAIESEKRENLLLQGLQFLAQKQKPHTLALTHVKTLSKSSLTPFLGDQLKSLDLSYSARTTSSLLSLIQKRCPNLEALSLEGCEDLESYHFSFPRLQILTLSKCPNLHTLSPNSPPLHTLTIDHSPKISAQNLYELAISFAEGKHTTRDPMKAVELWKEAALQEHHEAQKVLEWIDTLEKNPNIFDHYRKNDLEEEMAYVANALKINQTVFSLDISLGDLGVSELTNVLKQSTTITSLKLYGPQGFASGGRVTKFSGITDKGVSSLSNALTKNQSLITLEIDGGITDKGVIHLAKALSTNQTLSSIKLSGKIGAKGIRFFAEMLKVNRNLTTVDLENEKKTKGYEYLAQALLVNGTLLNLKVGEIDDEEAYSFAEILGQNCPLTHLTLRAGEETKITTDGALALARALEGNNTLISLSLEDHAIWNRGLWAFLKALEINHTLQHVDLTGNKIELTDSDKKSISLPNWEDRITFK